MRSRGGSSPSSKRSFQDLRDVTSTVALSDRSNPEGIIMKPFAILLASAAALVTAPSALPAQNPPQADTIDPSVTTQLPRTAIPHHYFLTVTPHAERLTFDGNLEIQLQVIKPTASLTFN